tara:strand:- start:49 stop:420 length:372 start_codon:yes stop_codon:yes gene_type:complete
MRFLKNKKFLFLIYGAINLIFTNIILQILLFILPVIIATFISQISNFSFGFYFYGKNVFKIKKLNKYHLIKYTLLNIFLWNLNWITIYSLDLVGFSKNITALLIIPILALISYIFQRFFIFVK